MKKEICKNKEIITEHECTNTSHKENSFFMKAEFFFFHNFVLDSGYFIGLLNL